MDHYQVLGVARNASQKEIEAAFETAKRSRPWSKEIYEAYFWLNDPDRRRKYDENFHDSYFRPASVPTSAGTSETTSAHSKNPGYIYVLINASMPGLLKIGKSTRPAEDRASELSRVTGVPTPFVVAGDWSTTDCDAAELEIHKRLEASRFNKDREFFRIPLKDAIRVISEVCERFNSEGNNGG